MANIKAWITVNGRHIPIMEGESKAKALANHFKRLRDKKISRRQDEHFDKMDEYAHSNAKDLRRVYGDRMSDDDIYEESHRTAYKGADAYMNIKYGKNWDKASDRTIKGYKKPRNDDKDERELDKLNSAIQRAKGYDSNGRASGRPDWQTVRALQDKKQKLITDINKDNKYKSYKLKEDKRPIDTQIDKLKDKYEVTLRTTDSGRNFVRLTNKVTGKSEFMYDNDKRATFSLKEGVVTTSGKELINSLKTSSLSDKRKITGVKKTNDTRKDFDGNEERKTETWGNQKYSTKEVRGKLRGMKVHDEERFGNAFIVTKTYDGLYGVRGIGDKSDAMTDYNAWTYGFREKWIIEDLGRRGYISNDNIKTSTRTKTYKDTTGKTSRLVVQNAYKQYMKEHPNSTMKLSTFEKTYKK